MTEIYPGKTVLAFNEDLWMKNGQGLEQRYYFRPATIVKIYPEDTSLWSDWKKERVTARVLVDVKFDNGRISKGHFAGSLKRFFERQKNES